MFFNENIVITDIVLTNYAKQNNISINDIVKFSISDDCIDYNLDKEVIKNLKISKPNGYVKEFNSLLYHNNDIFDNLDFTILSNGSEPVINNNEIMIGNVSEFDIICTNDEELFVEFTSLIGVKYVIIDEKDRVFYKDFKKNYIYIKNRIKICLERGVMNLRIVFYSVKTEKFREFNIIKG